MSVFGNVGGYIKEHPVLVGGGALILVVGFVVLRSAGGGSSTASTSGIDPTTAALAAQQGQQQTALQAADDQIAGQQNLATTQANYGLALAQIQANQSITNTNTAAGIQDESIRYTANSADLGVAASVTENAQNNATTVQGILAQLEGLKSNNATSLGLATTAAAEQESISAQIADVQKTISSNNTSLGIANVQGAVNIADTASNNSVKIAQTSAAGGVLGSLIGLGAKFI